MRVGLVSPFPWDVPGGVVAHIRDLAEALQDLGHEVSVMSPVDDEDAPLPPYVVRAGRSVPVPYNGSVARLLFGPVSTTRMRRWLRDGRFDVLHVHTPETLSLSLLAVMCARGPIVSTSHAHSPRSRILLLAQAPLQTQLEKIQGRIAVSPAARRTMVEHLGTDGVLIPNGVRVRRFADADPLPGRDPDGSTVGFLGRLDEPRKGLQVLLDALPDLLARRPEVRLLVAGPGDADELRRGLAPEVRERVTFLGQLSEQDKPRFYRSVDVFVAPNLGGESFGIVLLEAMAAGAAIVASDLDAFRRVLGQPLAGRTFPAGDEHALAAACVEVLGDATERARLVELGRQTVAPYDWGVVARQVVEVYETAVAAGRAAGLTRVAEDTVDPWDSSPRWSSASSSSPPT